MNSNTLWLIGRRFGAGDVVVGAPVDKIRHRPRRAIVLRRLRFSLRPAEVRTESVDEQILFIGQVLFIGVDHIASFSL